MLFMVVVPGACAFSGVLCLPSGSGGVMSGVGGLRFGLGAAGGWRLLCPPSIVSSCLPVFLCFKSTC